MFCSRYTLSCTHFHTPPTHTPYIYIHTRTCKEHLLQSVNSLTHTPTLTCIDMQTNEEQLLESFLHTCTNTYTHALSLPHHPHALSLSHTITYTTHAHRHKHRHRHRHRHSLTTHQRRTSKVVALSLPHTLAHTTQT